MPLTKEEAKELLDLVDEYGEQVRKASWAAFTGPQGEGSNGHSQRVLAAAKRKAIVRRLAQLAEVPYEF